MKLDLFLTSNNLYKHRQTLQSYNYLSKEWDLRSPAEHVTSWTAWRSLIGNYGNLAPRVLDFMRLFSDKEQSHDILPSFKSLFRWTCQSWREDAPQEICPFRDFKIVWASLKHRWANSPFASHQAYPWGYVILLSNKPFLPSLASMCLIWILRLETQRLRS